MIHPELIDHYGMVLDSLADGLVVPFLGAGVNLCGRPRDPVDPEKFVPWKGEFLPSGRELTEHLCEKFRYPRGPKEIPDLVRVSQYAVMTMGVARLYSALRDVLKKKDFPITAVHRFLASVPRVMREAKNKADDPDITYPLIITTNYDNVMERAFDAVGEPYDLVFYAALDPDKGKFLHRAPGEAPRPLTNANSYQVTIDGRECMLLAQRPVILKIHGAIDPEGLRRDSFVITEDDYIEYLTLPELTSLLPVPLPDRLNRCHFLFLGYALADWNMRAFLHRIWKQRTQSYRSWAVEIENRPIDREVWEKRDVGMVVSSLEDYFADLEELFIR